MHYYRSDFDELLKRFRETPADALMRRREAERNDKEIRDFVPYKVAARIREFITFSVKINGKAKGLKLDDETIKCIKLIEES